MPTTNERVSVLETKVDSLKEDVKELHDCLHKTRETLVEEIKSQQAKNTQEHAQVMTRLEDLNTFKTKMLIALSTVGPIAAYLLAHIDITKLF
jgi:hypothetical protein